MKPTTSTAKIIKALQAFEEQYGESEVLDIVVLREADRKDEYCIYLLPPSKEPQIVKIPSIDRTTLWKQLEEL